MCTLFHRVNRLPTTLFSATIRLLPNQQQQHSTTALLSTTHLSGSNSNSMAKSAFNNIEVKSGGVQRQQQKKQLVMRLPLCTASRQIHTSSGRSRMIQSADPINPPKPMTVAEVHDRVLKAIKTWDRFPQDRANKLTLDAHFAEDLSFDSLDLVEIVMVLEDEFDIEINEENAEGFKTPRDIASFVVEYMGVNDDEEF